MRLAIAAVGRLKDRGEIDLVDRYAKRIDAAGRALAIGPITITELAESRHAEISARKADEATRLSAALARADCRVILDETGQQRSSTAFAAFLQKSRDGGCREMAFVIGGPDGHGDAISEGAALVLSLGPMTLPHGLARVVLTEQIYRAITIISGHPYHRA